MNQIKYNVKQAIIETNKSRGGKKNKKDKKINADLNQNKIHPTFLEPDNDNHINNNIN